MTEDPQPSRRQSSPWGRFRRLFRRETLGKDAVAGVVLGVESVPDGLASGLLAGVNPVAGLYGYLFGMLGAAFFTSSAFMAVQATGAMALVVADTELAARPDPDRALFTLAMLAGVVMILAGVLKAGRLLRFVPTSVMTGFVTAVGVNIVLGQLSNLTGYESDAANRVTRALDLVVHVWQVDLPTTVVGIVTIGLIVWLTRTRLASFGLVVAVVVGSVLAWASTELLGWSVATISSIADVPDGLPAPALPSLEDIAFLAVPAISLAFVGLIQGAAVSAGVPNPDGRPADPSRDFIGQGIGNIVAGLFRGMPVGGSMSASALVSAAGARTRLALVFASGVMAAVILFASGLVAYVAMPSLAALLIVVGIGAVKPASIHSVVRIGVLQTTVMIVTFGLTLLIPLQFAVLVGVGLGIVLFVVQQSNRIRVRRIVIEAGGRMRELDPLDEVPAREVVMLQPYGSLFFASAPVFESRLPRVTPDSRGSVVVLRLRGVDQLGISLVEVLRRYAGELDARGSALRLVAGSDQVVSQLREGGVTAIVGEDGVYRGTAWLGETLRAAHEDALRWVDARSAA
ncbi:SulP family inorganic anion transporter [Agromyces mangrovi Wang et al. 2018]|uniref:SulP family inorganic anion transporter n=1 Tax=Agromyces mangrovi TaxID=1858653 RepID=UPI002573E113|nr:SulP family inorganic anion transporter [Agromyces mangrovi]BDZ64957.1 sodium-independent anion transporter [Agromyces mangrovi]